MHFCNFHSNWSVATSIKPHIIQWYVTLLMTSNYFRQCIAGYTVANLWRYPIRRHVTKASTLELLIYFMDSSKIFYWPFQGGTSFVDLLCFCSVLCLLCFVRVCLYVLRGHLLGKGWPLGSRLWCLLWVCHFPIGILGQVWYLIVSIPDLCNLTYLAFLNFKDHWYIFFQVLIQKS